MSQVAPKSQRAPLPSWIHEDASVVRLKANTPLAFHPAERRRAARIPVELTVFVHSGHHFFQAETADVSLGGMFLVTNRPLTVGTRMILDFALPGGGTDAEPLEVEATVRWTRAHDARTNGGPAGIAVAFENLSAEALARIEAYCKVREPLYFDLFEGVG